MAAALTRRTRDTAIILLGNSIALRKPAIRVAEEVGMLDTISGGRIISGFPVGSSMDVNHCYGVNPALLRDMYYEADDLIMKAWQSTEPFVYNGKYNKLRYVNIQPKPLQKPHPPIWVPGGGSIETWDFSTHKSYSYSALSYSGYKRGKVTMDGFWERAYELGDDGNPFRAGFLQLVAIGKNDGELQEFAEHGEFFSHKNGHIYPGFADVPGYRTIPTIKKGLLQQSAQFAAQRERDEQLRVNDPAAYKEMQDKKAAAAQRSLPPPVDFARLMKSGNIVGGTPDQVAEELNQVITDLRIGQLMVLCQYGSLPHDLAMRNIKYFTEDVLPKLKSMNHWPEYEDKWWPETAKKGFKAQMPAKLLF
jgi:alkanesulfonate monooxygenase SsuD/methylene tetrahydromethanopterin reductase-like flavin-dependent oxidoreductase (luciferase family)